jgi:peptidoglycan hydrolase FlgJ
MTTSVNPITVSNDADKGNSLRTQAGDKAHSSNGDVKSLKKVTQDFESLFIGMMLKSMRSTVGKDSVTGGGRAEEIYRSLLDQEYAVAMSKGSGMGLGRMMEEQLGPHAGNGDGNDTRKNP